MSNRIGPLTSADEYFCHQVVDTFAVVGSTDLSWTEKVCAMAAARDGSLQLGFGMGKYVNRDVVDSYGGISRGVEQVTVRASRCLSLDPEHTIIGPLHYEIIEPLHKIRFILEPNDCQPIAFDWLFEGTVAPQLEPRAQIYRGYRTAHDLVRWHQTGVCSGWVEVDGQRTEMTPDTWVSTRDRSWGVRYDVGLPLTDLKPEDGFDGASFRFIWCPVYMERPDGSRYGLFLRYEIFEGPGIQHKSVDAAVEHPDGHVDRILDIVPELEFDLHNRRLRGGRLHCTMADGSARPLQIDVVSDTGFHLGAGMYFGFNGHHHGQWRGEMHVEGERIADCSTPENARRLHQIRDTVIHVVDPVGGGQGWGNCQPMMTGAIPELGLTGEDSFI